MKTLALIFTLVSSLLLAAPMTFTASSGEVHGLGLIRTEKSKETPKRLAKFQATRGAQVPGSYDLSSRVSPPENQGGCGSCWDFALTKALRSELMLKAMDPGVLAFNYLLNNCGPGPKMWGCNGGTEDAGLSFLGGAGPWLESQDPYTQSEGRCKTGLAVAGTAIEYKTVSDGVPTFEELAQVVSQDHVLSITVAVCGGWGNYSGGIYSRNECGANSINHMINMVGYSCETSVDEKGKCVFVNGKPKNGDGYLIVMNNWGTSWGEKGYMRTRWGVDAIAYTAYYFEVKQAPKPPTPPAPTPSPQPDPGHGDNHIIFYGIIIVLVVIVGGLIGVLATRKKE